MTIDRDAIPCIEKTTTGLLESEPHKFSVDASDIRLPPGEWPTRIDTTLGNGQPFALYHAEERDGDLWWMDYMQCNGCIRLRIFND